MFKMWRRRAGFGNRASVFMTGCAITALFALTQTTTRAAEPTVIELTQVPCQFLESERGVNHGFKSTNIKDCEAVNKKTGSKRLAASKVINLKPGAYVFRVRNRNVPYDLGFWVRGEGLVNRAVLPSVSGGGLKMGTTKDYKITLKAGKYVYSCPLNPTPDYKLVVK